jgi:hypothetical protein
MRLDEIQIDTNAQDLVFIHVVLTTDFITDYDSFLHGLVLKPTANGGNEFTRAGWFRCSIGTDWSEYLEFIEKCKTAGGPAIYRDIIPV